MQLIGKKIYLRKVLISDTTLLLKWENNPINWEISGTTTPFTEEEIINFIIEQQETELEQIRLMICLKDNDEPIGAIDLFEIKDKKAGVGILINDTKHRAKGYASESLLLLKNFCKNTLLLQELFCFIQKNNKNSQLLFENSGFQLMNNASSQKLNFYICLL